MCSHSVSYKNLKTVEIFLKIEAHSQVLETMINLVRISFAQNFEKWHKARNIDYLAIYPVWPDPALDSNVLAL